MSRSALTEQGDIAKNCISTDIWLWVQSSMSVVSDFKESVSLFDEFVKYLYLAESVKHVV